MLPNTFQPPPLTIQTLQISLRIPQAMEAPATLGVAIRGGLGKALKHELCDPLVAAGRALPHGTACPCCALFAPLPPGDQAQLHGIRDAPRPYVVRPLEAERAWYRAGDQLAFRLVLIGWAGDYAQSVLTALQKQGGIDLSQGRGRGALLEVLSAEPLSGATRCLLQFRHPSVATPIPAGEAGAHMPPAEYGEPDTARDHHGLSTTGEHILAYAEQLPATLTLHFLTPMRIKLDRRPVFRPSGLALVVNALRRISTLCACYGQAIWEPAADKAQRDHLLSLAGQIRVRTTETRWVDQQRTSGATGQRMPLGGFIGTVTYENVPLPLRVVLLAGSLVHIGEDTVFGNGAYIVQGADGLV